MSRLLQRLPSPLVRIRSIKLKWSLIILAAVAVTAGTSQLGFALGWPVWIRPIMAGSLALVAVQVLAQGMTAPLRAMASQADKIANGDYDQRVHTDSEDEIGQLATSFNGMAERLAAVDSLQKDFIANASHELRTPVAAIQSQLENLVDRVSQPDPDTLQRMLQQTEHLSALVRQLLDLSRLDAATLGPARELVATGVLLKQVAHEAQLMHPGADIVVQLDGPLGISADEAMLHQLVSNLLANALRFSPIGAPVTVSGVGAKDHVTIEVVDEGPGIAPQIRTRAFERFWQADGTGPTGSGGAGLGLSICKRIVELHGGTISIHSNLPEGTKVRVRLPLVP